MHGDFHNSIFVHNVNRLKDLGVIFIPPRDDYGKHNIPHAEVVAAYVCAATSDSPLACKRILVTGGPTPVPVDNARRITNKFSGRLACEIAKTLTLRGAEVKLILGPGSAGAPDYVETHRIHSFEEYKSLAIETCKHWTPAYGVFSAAVADYRPKQVAAGKIPSGKTDLKIELEPTEKIIDLVQKQFPQLKMVSFKYQEQLKESELLAIAKDRILRGHLGVLANRGEDMTATEHVAHLVTAENVEKISGKPAIAEAIAQLLERTESQMSASTNTTLYN